MVSFRNLTGYICWIFLLSSRLMSCVVSTNLACREADFKTVNKGEPLEENVISSYYVHSWLECGEKCLDNDGCVTFSHCTSLSYEINCKLASESFDTFVNYPHDVKTWTTYEMLETEPEICLEQQPCKNSGRCVRRSCEPEGYMCICSKWYHGKHCQNENDNFDVVFLHEDVIKSYILTNIIKSSLTQFTFTVWFKFTTGLKYYHLLSYKATDEISFINLWFETASQPVDHFKTRIKQHVESSYMIPVNDNIWHHVGFAWNNENGRWDVLIDGTPRALRNSVETGKTIPGGGTLVIGQGYVSSGFKTGEGLVGQISGLNIWDRALTGQELEIMAESRGNEKGNILRWFDIVGSMFGNIQVVIPSNAKNTNKDLNFELQFGSNSSEVGYILSPGPVAPFDQLSICLWLKSAVTSTFVSYDVEGETDPTFSFGITASYHLFGKINGNLIKSTVSNNRIINDYWHFLCITWKEQNGNMNFYYDGVKQTPSSISGPVTQLSSGGKFSVGVTKDQNGGVYATSFVGKMSCVNIWSLIQSQISIIAMASGGMNINGDFLSWRHVQEYVAGNLVVVSNTVIYYPGYSLLAQRSQWCNDHVTSLSCGTLYARLGEGEGGGKMAWRCYCASALAPSKYVYLSGKANKDYVTKHDELLAVN